jgi:dihydrofolate reductase
MRKIIAITQLTLDGVMQAPGGPEEDPRGGFTHGGWAMPFGDERIKRALDETVAGDFDLLLGRRTYDIFASYWPHQDDNPVTKGFDRAVKYVITHRPDHLDWKTSRPIGGNIAEEVRRLKATNGPELHLWGSHDVLQSIIGADLIDEYRMWIAPVVLGGGKRLFENGAPPRALTLVETDRTTTGVLLNTYRPAGPVPKE